MVLSCFLLWRPPALPTEVPPCCSSSPWEHWSLLVPSLCLQGGDTVSEVSFIIFQVEYRWQTWILFKRITCANEHDIILAIGGVDSVHSDLREAVVDVSSDEDGPPAHRVDRVIHQRVVTCKLNHIVWETLCRLKTAECLTGTLKEENKHNIFLKKNKKTLWYRWCWHLCSALMTWLLRRLCNLKTNNLGFLLLLQVHIKWSTGDAGSRSSRLLCLVYISQHSAIRNVGQRFMGTPSYFWVGCGFFLNWWHRRGLGALLIIPNSGQLPHKS